MGKQATYRFHVESEDGKTINIDTLTEEERTDIGVWGYQNLVLNLGYEATGEKESE